MKTVFLAGGLGTRISEETINLPKPMIRIGDKPIIWHIMNCYKKYNLNNFIVCAGYKQKLIQEYFKDHSNVNVVDTGLDTQTGARIKKIKKLVEENENFFMTYGDGISNVNLDKLTDFHKKHGKIATLTAVRPLPRFGNITLSGDKIIEFKEKDALQAGWINGGFFILNKKVFDYISDKNDCVFEREPLQNLSKDGQLMAFKHEGFWHPMDTLRDKNHLNSLYNRQQIPWL